MSSFSVYVQIDDKDPIIVELDLNEKLSKIREKLEKNSLIRMNDTLLFAKKINDVLAGIAKENEEDKTLEDIVEKQKKFLHLKSLNEEILVYIKDSQSPVTLRLNLNDRLSKIWQLLEEKNLVKTDDILIFGFKSNDDSFITISIDSETSLIDIKNSGKMIGKLISLYLREDSEKMCIYFKNKYGLCRGINDKFEKANKPAFVIKNFKIVKTDSNQQYSIQIDSETSSNSKIGWLLSADVNINQNFAKLGVSIGNSKSKSSTNKINQTYNITEHKKATLTFELVPTTNFLHAVEDVINSENPIRKLKEVAVEFISEEVILGGKAYFEGSSIINEKLKESTSEGAISAGFPVAQVSAQAAISESDNEKKSFKYNFFRLFGGKQQFSFEDFNKTEWANSLDNFKLWDCIEIHPISIFKLLPEDKQGKILALVGKIIHYSTVVNVNYKPINSTSFKQFKLEIPDYITINDEKADYNIFAAVINKDGKEKTNNILRIAKGKVNDMLKLAKSDIFSCKVLWPQDEKPSLIIHCIQKEFKEHIRNLKIRWMIIGKNINFNFISPNYQLKVKKIDFIEQGVHTKVLDLECDSLSLCFGISVIRKLDDSNNSLAIGHHFFKDTDKIKSYIFSYCSEKKQYAHLPHFTFYTLIIPSCNDSSNDRGTTHCVAPDPLKYISLFITSENNHCPIFLKRKGDEIKTKHIKVDNCKNGCICKNKLPEYHFAYFDPKI